MVYAEINGHRVKYNTKLHKTYVYMLKVGYITSMVAIDKFKNTRLSASIHSLKNDYGVDIKVEYLPNKEGTSRYAKYYLTNEYINRRNYEVELKYKLPQV